MRFTALVVVGDGNGHVGAGLGKAVEIPEAIRKGKEDAMKHLVQIALDENNSITHDFIGKYGSANVLLKKAPIFTDEIMCGLRTCRHQEYPYQVSWLKQQAECCPCNDYRFKPAEVS